MRTLADYGLHFPPLHHRSELFLGIIPLYKKKVEVCWIFKSNLLSNSSRMLMWSRRRQHCAIGQPEFKKELVMVCSPPPPPPPPPTLQKILWDSSMSNYPQKNAIIAKERYIHTADTPGVHLCSHCLADHIHDVDKASECSICRCDCV